MNKPTICASGRVCARCRRKTDPFIRRGLVKTLHVLGAVKSLDVNFECPYGMAWGSGVDPPRKAETQGKKSERCSSLPGRPGSTIKVILKAMGIKTKHGCGCEAFCKQMNGWGWQGCITKHRGEVIAWFRKKADEEKVAFSPFGLIRLMLRAYANRLGTSET